MCSLNASLIINNKESIPLYLILKYVDPIIALQLFLNDNDTVDKKISIIIKFSEICENYNLMNDSVFFIKLGMEFFQYRIYMISVKNIISGLQFSQKTLEYASFQKNTHMLEWMHLFYCKEYPKLCGKYIIDSDLICYDNIWSSKVFENAVFNNDLIMLLWLNNNIYYCPHNNDIIFYAVKNKNLFLVEWLLQENFPKNEQTSIPALQYGNIKMLNLLTKYNCPHNPDRHIIAICYGQLNMLQYIYFKNPELFQNNKIYINKLTIKYNKKNIINWLLSKKIINV